jgi:hypothetical protein
MHSSRPDTRIASAAEVARIPVIIAAGRPGLKAGPTEPVGPTTPLVLR